MKETAILPSGEHDVQVYEGGDRRFWWTCSCGAVATAAALFARNARLAGNAHAAEYGSPADHREDA